MINRGRSRNRSVENLPKRPRQVDNLPSPDTPRWVASRKAAVVAAVRDGKITMASALHRYQLTEEEFLSWERAFESYGLSGLQATLIQQYRDHSAIPGTAPATKTGIAAPQHGPGPAPLNLGGRAQGTSKLDSNDQGEV